MGIYDVFNLKPPAGAKPVAFVPSLAVGEHDLWTTVPVGEEFSVELRIENFSKAPKGWEARWITRPLGAAVKVSITPEGERALVSIEGLRPSNGIVRSFVEVNENGKKVSYEFPPILVGVAPAGAVDPAAVSEDRGGSANVTDLEQDMGIFLGPWLQAALAGVQQFVTNELTDKIDDLSSGSGQGFLEGIIGNAAWAATVFFPGAGALRIFVVSMAGIAVASVPSFPGGSKSHIPEVQRLLNDYLFQAFSEISGKFRGAADKILKSHPEIKRYEALSLFAKASMAPASIRIDPSFKQKPKLNFSYISGQMEMKATAELRGWLDRQKAQKDAADVEKLIRDSSHRHGGEM